MEGERWGGKRRGGEGRKRGEGERRGGREEGYRRVPESNGEGKYVNEGIHLKDAEKEDTKMFKCFREEIPKEAEVRCLIRDGEAGGRG